MNSNPKPPFPDGKFTLSVIIPVYNEKNTIREVVHRVRALNLNVEIIIVDDGSTDGTREALREIEPLVAKVVFHDRNRGKGAAVRSGIEHITGDLVIIQDADLEYDPQEYYSLLSPILAGKADAVFGSRFMSGMPHRVLFYWHSVANKVLTTLSNMITNLNLTDMETCYKVLKAEVAKRIHIQEDGFGFEPEITAKLARMRCRIYEVGISYSGRGYEEGKKIGLKDALWALICLLRYGLLQRFSGGSPAKGPLPNEEPAASRPPLERREATERPPQAVSEQPVESCAVEELSS
ncbi:MAG: glycosyltransferase family 2 protein [Planctomycetes bacterium]|nr:glycosyltransferase family 2 protein [Planctomycetota bacterium]